MEAAELCTGNAKANMGVIEEWLTKIDGDIAPKVARWEERIANEVE